MWLLGMRVISNNVGLVKIITIIIIIMLPGPGDTGTEINFKDFPLEAARYKATMLYIVA